jgi:hypothetical protein
MQYLPISKTVQNKETKQPNKDGVTENFLCQVVTHSTACLVFMTFDSAKIPPNNAWLLSYNAYDLGKNAAIKR